MKKRDLSSAQIIPLGFLLVILIGTVLLLLPISTASGERAPLLTALFTATTSVCVTGLVVVDTFSYWSLFGKAVILVLIQIGGLGIVAVSASLLLLFRKSFSMRDRALLRDSFDLESIRGVRHFLRQVVAGVFAIEGAGALLYAAAFIPRYGFAQGVWFSVFHSVSAFCNAGLDLIGPDSLIPYQNDPYVLTVTMLLIVLGGLGYVVWFDIVSSAKTSCKNRFGVRGFFRGLSEHTRLVLMISSALILLGAGFTLLFEFSNPETLGGMPVGTRILNAFFQSVTYRTAGFASVPQAGLSDGSVLLGCVWMFIGGSPMGTAGGVKTSTVAVLILCAFAYIGRLKDAVAFRRRISSDLIRKAVAIVTASLLISLAATLALTYAEGLKLTDAMFEVFSATGTVGLSRGITPTLHTFGRIVILFCMYLGRISPVSLALFFYQQSSGKSETHFIRGRFFVG